MNSAGKSPMKPRDLPVEPDALFSLRFSQAPVVGQLSLGDGATFTLRTKLIATP